MLYVVCNTFCDKIMSCTECSYLTSILVYNSRVYMFLGRMVHFKDYLVRCYAYIYSTLSATVILYIFVEIDHSNNFLFDYFSFVTLVYPYC